MNSKYKMQSLLPLRGGHWNDSHVSLVVEAAICQMISKQMKQVQRNENGIHVEKKLRLVRKRETIYLGSEQFSSLCEAQLHRIL